MSRTLIERTVLVSLLISVGVLWEFWQALEQGASLEKARTLAMTTMVFFQFFQAWNSRSEYESIFRLSPVSNPFLFYGMIAAVLSQLVVVYVPSLQWVFRTEPINRCGVAADPAAGPDRSGSGGGGQGTATKGQAPCLII